MTRTTPNRIGLTLCLIVAATFASSTLVQATPNTRQDDRQAVVTWSRDIWKSANKGEYRTLERLLATVPDVDAKVLPVTGYRTALSRREGNRDKAASARAEARSSAVVEMTEYIEAGKLPQALRAAVKVQSFSDNFTRALDDANIIKIIKWAREKLVEVESTRDWLFAQEIQFRLRTLFEDTTRHDDWVRANDHLDWINRRVSLLAQFAPARLFELQNLAAIREGQEPVAQFNPKLTVDWRERVDGVTAGMLKTAMRIAAREHIEADGYAPLISGGLVELKIMATTPELAETFELLGDEKANGDWIDFLDARLERVDRMDNADADSITLARTLDDLVRVNDQTVHLPKEVLYHAFGEGAMYELDQFSEIVWPEKVRRFRQSTDGNFVGIGVLIRQNDKRQVEVVNPLEGTPAYFAGVKPEDVIVEVDGDSTLGWSLNDAVDHITGREGTVVTLTLRREGEPDLIEVPVSRKLIKLRSVKGWWKQGLREDGEPIWDWFIDPNSDIAYIRLTQFTQDSFGDLINAWNEITSQRKPSGLIFDLRYNPGGLLDASARISNLFLTGGTIVSGEDKNGEPAWSLNARPNRAAWSEVPTVVLINKGSASASEIVSGCLQAHGAAVVVGERSYGKGSVQTVHHVTPTAQMKLTTQYFRLPPNRKIGDVDGRLIHKRPRADEWGVDPDIEVKMTPAQVVASLDLRAAADIIPIDDMGNILADSDDRPEITSLLTEGLDPQLEMAMLILQSQALGQRASAAIHAKR